MKGIENSYYYEEGRRIRYKFLGWKVVRGEIHAPDSLRFSFKVRSPVVIVALFGPPEYWVCIDKNCNFYREGTVIPAKRT